jgi:hypothetical protein
MRNVVKQYSFIKKDTVSIKYFNWSKEANSGFPNGSNDLKSMGLKASKTKAVLQKESGEKPLSIWSHIQGRSATKAEAISSGVL